VPLLFFLAPFTLLGGWVRRRDPVFWPWLVYGLTLFTFSALLFAVHVPYGMFLHSAVALVPHAYLAGLVGIAVAVDAVARRRTSWDAQRARRVISMMVVGGVVLGSVGGSLVMLRTWRAEMDTRAPIVAGLADAPAADRVMSPDAGAYRYLAGRSGIVTPDDPLDVVEDALRAYGIRWLVLERDHLVPSLRPILAGDLRPDWLSAPLVVVPAPTSADAGADGAAPLPRAALHAVCLDRDDERCPP
jgi:hypothetical protein